MTNTEAGCWCGHPEDRHWTGATNMTFPDGCHDCPGWDGAHSYGRELPWAADYATNQCGWNPTDAAPSCDTVE